MADDSRFRYRREDFAKDPSPRARPAPAAPARPAVAAVPAAAVAPASDPHADPLAELARLIGEQDPFADFADLQLDPPPEPAPARVDPSRTDVAGIEPARSEARPSARADGEPALPRRYTQAGLPPDPAPQPPAPRAQVQPARARNLAPQPPVAPRIQAGDLRAQSTTEGGTPAGPRARTAAAATARFASPRGDDLPEDRSATAVRLGYGSLARQAPAQGTARAEAPRPAPGSDAPDPYYDLSDDDEASAPPPPAAAPRPQARGAQDGYAGSGHADLDREDARREDLGRHAARRDAAARGGGGRDEAVYAYSAPRRSDAQDGYADGYDEYDESYDPQYAEDGYMPPHGERVYDPEPRRRKGRTALLMVASVLGLVVAGTAGVFAYRMAVGGPSGSGSGGPPVIRAETGPSKIVAPAATPDAQQKLIYDRVGSAPSGNERVVPREEEPVDVTTAARAFAPAGDSVASINPSAGEPKKVRTMTVRADGSVVQDLAPVANAPSPGFSALAAYASGTNTAAVDPIAPAPPPATASPMQTASVNTAPGEAGAYVVQVASQRSEADAMGSWKALQTKYPNLLGGYRATVKRADLGDRGIYYRAQLGPFATRDQANELCQALRAQGGECVVNRN